MPAPPTPIVDLENIEKKVFRLLLEFSKAPHETFDDAAHERAVASLTRTRDFIDEILGEYHGIED